MRNAKSRRGLALAAVVIAAAIGGIAAASSGGDQPAGGTLDPVFLDGGYGGYGDGGAYIDDTVGGYIGGDGDSSYYFDPGTGCSVVPGDGVSC